MDKVAAHLKTNNTTTSWAEINTHSIIENIEVFDHRKNHLVLRHSVINSSRLMTEPHERHNHLQ